MVFPDVESVPNAWKNPDTQGHNVRQHGGNEHRNKILMTELNWKEKQSLKKP